MSPVQIGRALADGPHAKVARHQRVALQQEDVIQERPVEEKDPQYIVMDEVCGIFVTFMLIPLSWQSVLLGFILFRLFDVWKPFPIRQLEQVPRFGGILADDLAAGLYAWVGLFLIFK